MLRPVLPKPPLCWACRDTGIVDGDACLDCTRHAELRWVGARMSAALPLVSAKPARRGESDA